MSNKKERTTALQGLNKLIADAVIGITDLVEEQHQQILDPPFLPRTKVQELIGSISGFVYHNVRLATTVISQGIDKSLQVAAPLVGHFEMTKDRSIAQSILNGVVGDHLEESNNPFAIKMQFRHKGITLKLDPESIKAEYSNHLNGKILLLVHGSSMNDLQWNWNGHNHGTKLSEDLNKTPLYLLYNSGRHISTNGQEFSQMLDNLVKNWPVPVEEITILAHSMGGLISRSAFYYAEQETLKWTSKIRKIVFLGTPHQGAPLERIGNYIDHLLDNTPYLKAFSKIGKIRSAAVTDLRYGSLVDEDWKNKDRFKLESDQRKIIPLPKGVECYTIAATLGAKKESKTNCLGDKLVAVNSALGKHKEAEKDLNFKKEHSWVAYQTDHFELLSKPKVYKKIKSWLI